MADYDEIARSVAAFTSGNDPNPGGRFPTGSYLTPDEARERGVAWTARPGEPQDLSDPWHYQTQDDSRRLGRDWASQPAIRAGNARHAGFTPDMTVEQIRRLGMTTPDERNLASLLQPTQGIFSNMPVDRAQKLADLLTEPTAAPLQFFSRT